ncbi:ABC transporter substrate-binding protein [Streptacidiphilus sp. N1-3]|uniref:ABC transporter substrate-binding protein n=1 Tax=Streptacidiphilus alkalitolerans TaxID=3342712 RepID=A0ABV6WYB2_9ACTN
MNLPDQSRSTVRGSSSRLRRLLAATAVGASLALTAGACASGSGSAGGAAGSGTAAGDTSFSYWSMWNKDEPQAKVLQAAIDQFTKDTGIKVTVQWKGRQVATQLAPTLNTSHVPADLIDSQDRFAYAQLQATGQALDLTPVLKQAVPGEGGSTVGSVLPKTYLDLTTTDGSLWEMPYEVVADQVWYNAADLPAVAANPPATWAAFTQLLAQRKAARGGAGPLALDADIPDYAAFWTYYSVLRTMGPGAFGAAATDRSGAKFEDPAFLDALNKVEQLIKAGDFTAGYNGSKWPAVQQKWAAGKSDFLLLGTFTPSETGPFAKAGFQYRSFPFPAMTAGGDTTQDVSTIGFSIPKKAEHAAAAEKFIAYFMAKSQLSGISTTAQNITPRADIPAPAALADAQKAMNSGKVAETLDGVKETAAEWYTKVFLPLNTSFIDGSLSPSAFAAKLKSGTADYWKMAS